MHVESRPELLDRLITVPAVRELLSVLGNASGVHLVGGAVRDTLRGVTPIDLDLVVERDLEEIVRRLSPPARASARVHERFATATITAHGARLDLARARRETYACPGALPEVEPATLAQDLLRRDFTINALALTLSGEHRGELLAVPGALEDLSAGTLRVLHDASFRDDPTRLLRLARYAARLGFTPDPRTRKLAANAIAAGALATVSGARLGAELRLLAAEADPAAALSALERLGLDAALIPGFGLRDPALLSRALVLAPPDADMVALALAAAALEVAPEDLARALDELALEAHQRDVVLAAAADAPRTAAQLAIARCPSEIASAVAVAPVELVALAGALGPDAASAAAGHWIGELRHIGLKIDGNDLLAAGVRRGPAVGAGLRAALAATLDGGASSRDEQLAEALRVARGVP